MGKTNNIGTFTLTTAGGPNADGVYTIAVSDGVSRAAFSLTSGSAATVHGSAVVKGFGGISGTIALSEDKDLILSTNNENEFLDVVIITVTSGTVEVVCNQ